MIQYSRIGFVDTTRDIFRESYAREIPAGASDPAPSTASAESAEVFHGACPNWVCDWKRPAN